jgi:hypothetical protein
MGIALVSCFKIICTVMLFIVCDSLALLLQLKPVRSLESFKHSSDSWWSSPSQSPRLGAPMSSPTATSDSDYDLFGSTPFVVGGGDRTVDGDPLFVVASPSSVDLVRLPPPALSHASKVNIYTVCLVSRPLPAFWSACMTSLP